MARLPRLLAVPFGWYYVTLHPLRGRRMVTDKADLATFLHQLVATLTKNRAHLHAGFVAGEEAHLVLQAGERPLSTVTGAFCHRYALAFNARHHERGLLFKPHRHALLFQQQTWLVPLARFVHWIPMLRPSQFPAAGAWWSSEMAYHHHKKRNGLTTNVVVRILSHGSASRQTQQKAYQRYFSEPPDPNHIQLFAHGSPEDPRILGDSQFIAEMLRFTGQPRPRLRKRPELINEQIRQAVIEVIEDFNSSCEKKSWVTLEEVCSKSRKRPLPMVRALSVSYVLEHGIATRKRAARFFGCHPTTLSAGRRRHYEAEYAEWTTQARDKVINGAQAPVQSSSSNGEANGWIESGERETTRAPGPEETRRRLQD